jgi:hypothetical protein
VSMIPNFVRSASPKTPAGPASRAVDPVPSVVIAVTKSVSVIRSWEVFVSNRARGLLKPEVRVSAKASARRGSSSRSDARSSHSEILEFFLR